MRAIGDEGGDTPRQLLFACVGRGRTFFALAQ